MNNKIVVITALAAILLIASLLPVYADKPIQNSVNTRGEANRGLTEIDRGADRMREATDPAHDLDSDGDRLIRTGDRADDSFRTNNLGANGNYANGYRATAAGERTGIGWGWLGLLGLFGLAGLRSRGRA